MTRYLARIFCLLLFPFSGYGDAVVTTRAMTAPTIVQIYIEEGIVRIELEIGLADIPGFKNLLPDTIYEKMGNDPQPFAQRVDRFYRDDLVIEADGEIIPGRIRQMEPRKRIMRDEITGEPLLDQSEGEHILFAELVYPDTGSPETLAISPPRNEQGQVAASIGLMVYHQGLPVMDFRYLSREETLHLDWVDPWYSRFENKNLRRQYNEPISVFLYAEPFETRVEIIVRPKDIQQWHDLGIQGSQKITVEMQPALKEKVAAFLLTELQLAIDGEPVVPELQRINFLKRNLKSSVVIDPTEELDSNSATLGVIYSAPTATLPNEAEVTWNLFSPKSPDVRAAATDEAGPLPSVLRPDDNVLIWRNFLTHPTIPTVRSIAAPRSRNPVEVPLVSLLCLILFIPLVRSVLKRRGKMSAGLGGGLILACAVFAYPFLRIPISVSTTPELTDQEAREVVFGLLENVYTSFDFRDENTIYDALDHSLAGDLLTAVYLQTMKSLELASQGGARVKVKSINLEEIELQSSRQGVRANCVWDVLGSVGHWGHIHQRINRYEAELEIEVIDGQWKIASLQVLEEQRIR